MPSSGQNAQQVPTPQASKSLSSRLRISLLKNLFQTDTSEEKTFFALTLITGILSACTAVGLYKLIYFLTDTFGTNRQFTLQAFIYGLIATVISGYLTTRKFPTTAGSGIPGVKVALSVFHGKLPFKNTIAKFVTSVLSLSSGFSLGREGPTVAIAAGIGSFFGDYFHLTKKRVRALVAVGSAGGIAAAFATPMAAVVFTLEEVVGDLNEKMLGSIVISSVVASVVGQYLMGNRNSYFTELHYTLNDPRELLMYLCVGIMAALVGTLWVKSVLKYRALSIKIFKGHKLTIITLTFFAIVGFSFINPAVLGSGHGTIEEALLSLILDWKVLLSLLILKFIATTMSYGSGISGGLFMPTLLMGAILGALVGTAFKIFFPEIAANSGAFAIVGMGAFFATVIRAPFTSIIMVFELTRDYNIILPLMISNIVSYLLASRIHQGSIYENISEQDGIHLPKREDNEILESMNVEDAMTKDVITLGSKLSIKDAMAKIKNSNITGYPVLENGLLIGLVSVNDIASAYAKRKKGQSTLADICRRKIIKVYPDQSLFVALHLMNRFSVSRLPVVSRLNDKVLSGIITPQDIVKKFGYQLSQTKEGEPITI